MNMDNALNAEVSSISALGRLLIALIFIRARWHKQAGFYRGYGIPYPDILVWGAIALELGGSLMLVAGLYARWVALAFFFYTLSLALIFHAYWTVRDPAAARSDANSFFGHLSMMGGMLFVVAFGGGAFSFDALMAKSSTADLAARRLRLR
jgi:putative oxidoreductase